MSKTLLVAWGQIKKIALHWSFLLVVCYPPLMVLILASYALFVGWAANLEQSNESLPAPGMVITNEIAFDQAVGLVDQANLIKTIPADLDSENLFTFPNEAAVQAAIQSGSIVGYYLIPSDYLQSGLVIYFSPTNEQFVETDDVIRRLIMINLAAADGEGVARRVADSVVFEQRSPALAPAPSPDAPDIYTPAEVGIGVGIVMFVYFTIGSVCGNFLNQIASEREGRVLEMVLSTLTPLQLLTGKFIGILVVGLIETGAWFFWVQLFGALGAQMSAIGGLSANASTGTGWQVYVVSSLIYIGGYVAYTATAAVFAALVKDTRQASRINFMLMMATLFPLVWLISVLADRDGALAVALSLFPLTAPIIMTLRIFISPVPAWQIALCLIGLAAWTVTMLGLAGRLFQARLLLNDAPLFRRGLSSVRSHLTGY
jgi:ABC-2 type transport system permease protein